MSRSTSKKHLGTMQTQPRAKRQKGDEDVGNKVTFSQILVLFLHTFETSSIEVSGFFCMQILEEKMTAKIMKEARAQNQDLEDEGKAFPRIRQRQVQYASVQ